MKLSPAQIGQGVVLLLRYKLLLHGVENASASAFPVATRLELVDKSCCGVSERTTIKWINSLHFEDSLQLVVAKRRSRRRGCRELQSAPMTTDTTDFSNHRGQRTQKVISACACPPPRPSWEPARHREASADPDGQGERVGLRLIPTCSESAERGRARGFKASKC